MKIITITAVAALTAGLSACEGTDAPQGTNQAAPTAEKSAEAAPADHRATGTVTAVSGSEVTISHGPVETIGWPAMTMAFSAENPQLLQGIKAGDRVSFEFRQAESGFALSSLTKL